jgi:phage terminase large subunit GpA-like protein
MNSPWIDWRVLCDEFREARARQDIGDDSPMRVFCNTRLARPYRLLGKRVEVDLYHDRREVYSCHAEGAEVPSEVLLITAAVDVHDARLVYEIVGWGPGRESWGIETGQFEGDPRVPPGTPQSIWNQIDSYLYNRVLRTTGGGYMRPRLFFVDSGGHATDIVYKYCKPRHPRVFAIKGVGGAGKPIIIGGRQRERAEGTWLLRLGVDTLKDEFHSRLAVEHPGPGYCHWPAGAAGEDVQGYNEAYFRELVAEQRVLKYTSGGFARYEWHKNRTDPNEAFDLRCYARAALEYLRVRLEKTPRDILAHFNPNAIQKVEVGLGRVILTAARSTTRESHAPSREPTQFQGWSVPEQSTEAPPPQNRYGAVTSSFE